MTDRRGPSSRIQLSLFVPQPVARLLEAVRARVDPVQFALIPAHVTLCREDELDGIEDAVLRHRFAELAAASLSLEFGPPEPFHEHGILLPCVAGDADFQALRRWVLDAPYARHHPAHITLAHPRNPKARWNDGAQAVLLATPLSIRFDRATRIVQEPNQPWRALDDYPFGPPRPPAHAGRKRVI